jgi:hypothetical protein
MNTKNKRTAAIMLRIEAIKAKRAKVIDPTTKGYHARHIAAIARWVELAKKEIKSLQTELERDATLGHYLIRRSK